MAPPPALRRAATYVRMSTDQQRYSIANQSAALEDYARAFGFEIVRAYADEGVSGLTMRGRRGLQQLLADVVGGDGGFETVLVFDISRWGRFQNPDQAAHYEFLCAQAGVTVEYCAERFPNDGSLSSTLMKSLRRVMAAEFSRDLSAKVSRGRRRLFAQGYWLGGSAGYGLRRLMVSHDGRRRLVLEYGEGKGIIDCHTILVPGPTEEVALVARIYRMLTVAGLTVTAIARRLNEEGVVSEQGRPWSYAVVRQILSNPKYLGDLVAERVRCPLGGRPARADPSTWIRVPGAFEPIIDRRTFAAAQAILARRCVKLDRPAMLAAARALFDTHGELTYKLIDETPGLPGSFAYRNRFGRIDQLCEAIGRPGPRRRGPRLNLSDEEMLRRLAALYRTTGYLSPGLINAQADLPGASTYARRFGGIHRAYAKVGYVQLTIAERRSPVGRARTAAARALARTLV